MLEALEDKRSLRLQYLVVAVLLFKRKKARNRGTAPRMLGSMSRMRFRCASEKIPTSLALFAT